MLPQTLDQAVDWLLNELSQEEQIILRGVAFDDLIGFHHSLGQFLRNKLGMWDGNDELVRSCCVGDELHPDTASQTIIEVAWTRLQARS